MVCDEMNDMIRAGCLCNVMPYMVARREGGQGKNPAMRLLAQKNGAQQRSNQKNKKGARQRPAAPRGRRHPQRLTHDGRRAMLDGRQHQEIRFVVVAL